MLPSMQTTTNSSSSSNNNNNNRCLVETERDVAHVEYDVINYYTDDVSSNPDAGSVGVESTAPQQRCSRVNNNNNTLLDVVVHSRATRSDPMEEDAPSSPAPSPSPTSSNSSGSNSSSNSSTTRCKGGGNSGSKRSRETAAAVPTTPTLGVNMRVTGQCSQGGRKYMEDQFSVAYQESPLTHELEYAFFGIYDGHGGTEAALFAKEHLMLEIVKQKQFWSDNDEDVLRAIREGYIGTHFAMWREQEKWPRTANGHLSTAGTTATVAFMRREKIYIGHVGDSGIVLGYQHPNERRWRAKQLTTDHKPESMAEKTRIQRSGGQVAIKSGVPRVVWNRPRDPMHRGPIRQRTVVDDIPFLAVARSLGDLWSYNSRCNEFVVSPDPDVKVVKINPNTFRCLIFGTDGLWNVITAQEAVDSVREKHMIGESMQEQDVMNPSKALVDKALKTWATKKMRADNTSVVTVILTPAAESTATKPTTEEEEDGEEVDVDVLGIEPMDTENKYPSMSAELEHEMDLCASIEEKEYLHETPYSALAKRHLPPEPYRNFDYYIEDDYETEQEQEQEHDHEQDVDDEIEHVMQHSKFWRKSMATWQQQATTSTPMPMPMPATLRHRQQMMETEHEVTESSMYANELEHSYESYVSSAGVVATTEYSFAESYNSLLNEQQAARSHQQQQQQQQQSQQLQQQQQHQTDQQHQPSQQQQQQQQLHNSSSSMQEILQEQQRYQQQEGYSLTQLETRHEQQQQQQQQQQQVVNSRWQQQTTTYVEQPAELLALNALLQQERDEEQQLALEREQQQQREQQLLLVEASSSSSSSQPEFVYAPPWSDNVATLQDNEVSSTLPVTPTPTPLASSSNEMEQEPESESDENKTQPSNVVEQQQPQQLLQAPQQQQQQLPLQQQQQQQLHSEPKLRRQMRRYRNVPNENHQHMQTRRRQLFKHSSKTKSFISAAAAAIIAYNSNNNSNNNNSSGSNNNTETLPHCSSSHNNNNNNNSSISSNINSNNAGNNSNTANGSSSSNSRRRSVVSSGSSSGGGGGSGVMMTRRSHSVGLANGGVGSVNKRQLRSSICQLAQLGNLDLTKRTLRTRNATSVASNNVAARPSNNNNNNKKNDSPSNNNNNNNNSSNNNNGKVNGKASHTFNKPATPTTTSTTSAQAASPRRLRRNNEEREQRRSLRCSTLSAGNSDSGSSVGIGSSSGSGISQFSKPTRLQSCSGGIAARPPPSPKKLNAVIPTLAIGTRAYTAAMAAASDLTKRWSLRSSSSTTTNNTNNNSSSSEMASLVTAISCYSARSRTAAAAAQPRRR